MRIQNWSLAALAAIAGFFITFSQSHAVAVGRVALLGFAVGLVLVAVLGLSAKGGILAWLPNLTLAISGLAVVWLEFDWQTGQSAVAELEQFNQHVIALAVGFFVSGVLTVYFGKPDRQQRIQVVTTLGLSVLAALVFWLAPLDDINAVGLLGAYFVLLAVNWGVSAASPK